MGDIKTARIMAMVLLSKGFPVVEFSEGDEVVDGEVTLLKNKEVTLSVQVPNLHDYGYCLGRWVESEGVMHNWPITEDLEILVSQIKVELNRS